MMPIERPGVRALRGAAPVMTPEMERMRRWAESQRAATAANARNGDFIVSGVPSGTPAGVPLPTQLPTQIGGGAPPAAMPKPGLTPVGGLGSPAGTGGLKLGRRG